MNWYIEVFKKYAVFGGRAHRTEYWMFVLFNFIIASAIGFIEGLLGSPYILDTLYTLAVIVPGIAVSVRRLQDTDRSGFWLLIAFVPVIGVLALIYFMVQDSQPGSNQYGPCPK